MVKGDVAFRKRQKIVTEFDSTINGILICTQQSLSSSVNIPTCNDVILESLQWNIPRMEQFYFRFIRLDSKEMKDVHYVTYEDSVEQNLMALVLTKERLNEFIKTGEVKEQSEISRSSTSQCLSSTACSSARMTVKAKYTSAGEASA